MILDKSITWDMIPDLIQREITAIGRILEEYPYISTKINLKVMGQQLIEEFVSQMNRADVRDDRAMKLKAKITPRGYKYHTFYEDMDDYRQMVFDGNKEEFRKIRVEWAKFKSKYLLWAKNLIAMFNTIKRRENVAWLDTKKFAEILAGLELAENKLPELKEDSISLSESLFDEN